DSNRQADRYEREAKGCFRWFCRVFVRRRSRSLRFDAFVSGAKLVRRPSAWRWTVRSTSSVGTPLARGGVPLARLLRAVRRPPLVLGDIVPGDELRRQKLDGGSRLLSIEN